MIRQHEVDPQILHRLAEYAKCEPESPQSIKIQALPIPFVPPVGTVVWMVLG